MHRAKLKYPESKRKIVNAGVCQFFEISRAKSILSSNENFFLCICGTLWDAI